MLDKTKIYKAYTKPVRNTNQTPSKRFQRIKILFEDDISFYVESLTEKDGKGFGKRYSVKKHCYLLIPINEDSTPEICKNCSLRKTASILSKLL